MFIKAVQAVIKVSSRGPFEFDVSKGCRFSSRPKSKAVVH